MIIGCDFDGTLCENAWPRIGPPIRQTINYLKRAKAQGHRLVLITMRENELLDQALGWCDAMGIEWDAVNDNLPDMIEKFGNNPRKVFADVYIDDRNALCGIGRKLPKM